MQIPCPLKCCCFFSHLLPLSHLFCKLMDRPSFFFRFCTATYILRNIFSKHFLYKLVLRFAVFTMDRAVKLQACCWLVYVKIDKMRACGNTHTHSGRSVCPRECKFFTIFLRLLKMWRLVLPLWWMPVVVVVWNA